MAFVFAALVEFTCVNYLWRKRSNPYKVSKQMNQNNYDVISYYFLFPNKLDPYSLSFSGFPQHADYDAEMCGDGANRYP